MARNRNSAFSKQIKDYKDRQKKKSSSGSSKSKTKKKSSSSSSAVSTPANANFSSFDGTKKFIPPPNQTANPAPVSTPANANFSSIDGSSRNVSAPSNSSNSSVEPPPFGNAIQAGVQNLAASGRHIADQFSAQSLQEELFATTGVTIGNYTPTPNTEFSSVQIPFSRIGSLLKIGQKPALQTSSAISQSVNTASKVVEPEAAVNTLTLKNVGKILGKRFPSKTMALMGAWAGAVFLGKWGEAESTEPLSIVMGKYLVPEAQRTGDWSAVEEAQRLRNDLLDLTWWEEAASWSPVSPLIGIPRKIKGAIYASKVTDAAVDTMRTQSVTGESNSDMWTRINAEKAARDAAQTDYYNEQALITEREKIRLRQEAAVETDARTRKILEDTISAWDKYAQEQRLAEAKARQEQAEFWLDYQKELQKLSSNNTPSKLNFGLI